MINKKLYDVLNTQIDVAEAKYKNNPVISDYHAAVDGKSLNQSVPWCASFVNWGLKEIGVTGTGVRTARSFLNWGVECEIKLGAVAVIKRGTKSWQGHVGIVTAFDDNTITLLGGNQSNKVCEQKFKRSRLIGCRKIKQMRSSKTVGAGAAIAGASCAGIVAESITIIREVKTTVDTTKVETGVACFNYVSMGLGVLICVLGLFVIYERVKKNKKLGI